MHFPLLNALGQFATYALLVSIPVLSVLFTERFRRTPNPGEYAILFALVALIGIVLSVPALILVFGAALLALGIAQWSARLSLVGVSYERSLSPARLFPGEQAQLRIRVKNDKIMPLSWMSIDDPVHCNVVRATGKLADHLRFSGGIEMNEHFGHSLVNRLAVGPYGEVLRTYTLTARQRGVYTMGPATLCAGDLFGTVRRRATVPGRMDIIVYPSILRSEEVTPPFRESLGKIVARRAPHQDPTLIAGSRDYRRGDPLRHVHWKATARTGALQVRVNDPSTTAQLMIVLNVNTFAHVWQGVDPERMEAGISVAASLALWALQDGFAVGLRSNGTAAALEETPRIAPSANPRQEVLLLEHLARLSFSGRYAPEVIVRDEAQRLPGTGSIIFVTSTITPPLIGILTSRRLLGRVSVVYCGRFAAPVVPGVPIHLVAPPRQVQRAVS